MKRVSFHLNPKISTKSPRSPFRLFETCALAYFILLMNERFSLEKISGAASVWRWNTRMGQIARVKRGSLRNDVGNNNNASNEWFAWLNEEKWSRCRCGSLFGSIFLPNDDVKVSYGRVRKHDVDGSENVIWKSNIAILQSFLNYYSCKMCFNYPGRKLELALQT